MLNHSDTTCEIIVLSCLTSIYLKELVEESVQFIFVRLDGVGQPVQPATYKGESPKILGSK